MLRKADRMVFDATQIAPAASSALDVLRQTPGVNVSDGGISLIGKGGVDRSSSTTSGYVVSGSAADSASSAPIRSLTSRRSRYSPPRPLSTKPRGMPVC